jgi:membrane fusion protein (multidrug efflux system)
MTLRARSRARSACATSASASSSLPARTWSRWCGLDPIEVDFSVPESALRSFRRAEITSRSMRFQGEVFSGQVEAIDPVIDPNTRSAKLRAQIPNPDGRLRPGQFAQLQLDTGGPGGEGVLVPEGRCC